MKKLIVFGLVSFLLSACVSENENFPEEGKARHASWTLEYQTMVSKLYFCTYIRESGHRGFTFTTPSETPCKERL